MPILALLLCAALCGCASIVDKRGAPEWTEGPARSIHEGRLAFVARSEAAALDDLANECTFVPKGTRIDERYEDFTKVSVGSAECETARKTIDPDAIRAMASSDLSSSVPESSTAPVGFVEYHPDEGAVEIEVTPPPLADESAWLAARQQIVVAKREIITSPPETFATGSEERDRFLRAVEPAQGRIISYESSHPRVAGSTWSSLPVRPRALPPLGAPVYRPAPPPRIVDETPPPERDPASRPLARHHRPRRQKR